MDLMTLERPALGETASLGSLYDARTDNFIGLSLLKGPPPENAVRTTDNHTTHSSFSTRDTYKDKFDNMRIGGDLSASFLAGLVTVGGSGRYLADKRESNLVIQASLHHHLTTVNEELDLDSSEIREQISFEGLSPGANTDIATHVVTKISWGARNIVTAKREISRTEKRDEVMGQLRGAFKPLTIAVNGKGELDSGLGDTNDVFEITVHGDVFADAEPPPTNFKDTFQFIKNIPRYIASANGGKGMPLTYTLLPLQMIYRRCHLDVACHVTLTQIHIQILDRFVHLFDDLHTAIQTLSDYLAFLEQNSFCIPKDHVKEVTGRVRNARLIETSLKLRYAECLKNVRSGNAEAEELRQLCNAFSTGESSPEEIASNTNRFREKIDFVQFFVSKGAEYIGFNDMELNISLAKQRQKDTYIFHFNEATRAQKKLWAENVAVLLARIEDNVAHQPRVILYDCDAQRENLPAPRISHTYGLQVMTYDLLKEVKSMAHDSIIRYQEQYLDREGPQRPINSRSVKIPCPGLECTHRGPREWKCFRCRSVVEYGHIDSFIYCRCGRCDYRQWDFRCDEPKHGLDFKKYGPRKLIELLQSIEPFEELNILILGPTGVGKSTWINAFINYLEYQSLDEALKANKLSWVVPFSFSEYILDDDGAFQPLQVEVGFGDKISPILSNSEGNAMPFEQDGSKGDSATQMTNVHRIQTDDYDLLIRLIDTPGIGDTRGLSQHQTNIEDILQTIRAYEKIHGILILLKPDNPRLDLAFRFCVQEMLTYLHKSAAKNMAFGFTNSRGTNYRPGQTFDPLQALLSQYKDANMELVGRNVYCFDSESFRYLAAYKTTGADLGHLEESRQSWDRSHKECTRLIKHFKELEPHAVRSTINLNETRNTILHSTKPLADIAAQIQSNIAVLKDQIKDLERAEVTGTTLRDKLKTEIKVTESRKVAQPRTVCSNKDCIVYWEDGTTGADGKPKYTTIYPQICHATCHLSAVKANLLGDKALRDCVAFVGEGYDKENGNDTEERKCKECRHHWEEHLHIDYEVREIPRIIEDPDIKKALEENENEIEIKMKGIKSKEKIVADLKDMSNKIKDAAARFSVFLKNHSITPYNDATLEYLDQLIKQERGKVSVGGSRENLDFLEQYRAEYEERIQVLEENLSLGNVHEELDQKGAELLIHELYSLPYCGQLLKTNSKVMQQPHRIERREMIYHVKTDLEEGKRPSKGILSYLKYPWGS
ncbi:hypothetical protein EIK77_010758 [Talaromyces pinophilus]|nr:hypothetical protein EIK77_010758 [Talaromyces pinophilus]PCH07174.1 Hypothetical protein PENO1_013220 [Penicillium occitanis (nom. inval.)]PCH10186.1 hypothetical protein PENOC_003030 [Penicillium occitanis (nom. inval.)]